MEDRRLRKSERIRKRKEFENVLYNGFKGESENFKVYVLIEEKNKKIGIITKRKLGKAYRRNRIKRLLREVFRLNKGKIREGAKIIVYVKKIPNNPCYKVVEEEILSLFEKMKILK